MTTSRTCACGCGAPTNTTPSGKQRTYVHGHNRRGVGKGWIEGGYRYLYVDGVKIAEHRHIVEQRLGRKLSSNEVVHHVDGDRLNNDPNNFAILSRAEHSRLHACSPRRRWSLEEKARARALHQIGMTIQQVSKALGRPFSSTAGYVRTNTNESRFAEAA
jgi:hypothetical protein